MTESHWLACTNPSEMLDWLDKRNTTIGTDPRAGRDLFNDRRRRLFACAVYRAAFHEPHCNHDSTVVAEQWIAAGCPEPKPDRGWFVYGSDPAGFAVRMDGPSRSVKVAILRDLVGNPYRPLPYPCCEGVCRIESSPGDATTLTGGQCPIHGASFHLAKRWLTPQVLQLARVANEVRVGRTCERCGGTGSIGSTGDFDQYHIECPLCSVKPGFLGTGRIEDGSLDLIALAALGDALEEAGCTDVPCQACTPNFKTGNGFGLGWLQGHDSTGYFNIGCENCGGKGLIDHGGKIGTGRVSHPILTHLHGPGPHYHGCWAIEAILGVIR